MACLILSLLPAYKQDKECDVTIWRIRDGLVMNVVGNNMVSLYCGWLVTISTSQFVKWYYKFFSYES